MKEAIKKAIEGGWKPEKYREIWEYNPNNQIGVRKSYRSSLTHWDVCSDPLFWQALGKALGWYQEQEVQFLLPEGEEARRNSIIHVEDDLGVVLRMFDDRLVYAPYSYGKPTWKQSWHRFIDHLAEGKDADSFFPALLGSLPT